MVLVSSSIALAQWPQATYSNRYWEFEATGNLLDRPASGSNLPLIQDAVLNNTLFTSEDALDLETAVGIEVQVTRKNLYGWEWEFEFGHNDWDTEATVNSPNDISSPLFTPIEAAITNALGAGATDIRFTNFDYAYRSRINNYEINLRRAVRPGLTLLIGPRFINIKERTDIQIDGDFNFLLVPVNFTNNLEAETNNPMFGLQVGADVFVPLTRQVYATGLIKVGGYGNTAKNTVIQRNSLDGSVTSFTNRRSQGSFVAEVGGKLHYDVVPGRFSFFGGYQATWYDNIALAPTQVFGLGQFQVQMSGTPVAHGFQFGATVRR